MATVLLDPSIGSTNEGDSIISESILAEFPEWADLPRVATHRFLTGAELTAVRAADTAIVLGTNILSSRQANIRQWRLGPRELAALRGKVVLLGVGWRRYGPPADLVSRRMLRWLLKPGALHSTRDAYTERRLRQLGHRVVNTSCPTLWSIGDVKTPGLAADRVVATVTDYVADVEADSALLDTLAGRYDRVQLWPQGEGDRRYIDRLRLPTRVELLSRGLPALRSALAGAEYVGTRLHAGALALQLARPGLIVGTDNRALEIARDTGLPVLPRARLAELGPMLAAPRAAPLDLPVAAVDAWRSQWPVRR
jgi:hypothetical protein